MRAVVGPLLLNLLILGAGVAVLQALGVVERSVGGVFRGLGLGFMVGCASVGLITIALLCAGVPFAAPTVVVVALAIIGGARFVTSRRRVAPQSPTARLPHLARKHWLTFAWALLFAAYAIIGALRAAVKPLSDWDSWAIWTRKAVLLFNFQHLPALFLTGAPYGPTHPNYPLLLPTVEAMWFRFAGRIDTRAVHLELWLLLVAFIWAAAYLLARRRVPVVVWGPVLLAFALASGVTSQLTSGYADIPMALFAGLGLLLLGQWVADERTADLWLAALLLAAAANTKNEGLPIAIIALVAAALFKAPRWRATLGRLGLAGAGVIAAVLPWQLWIAIHGVPSDSDVPLSKAVDIPYLFGRTSRLSPTVSRLHTLLLDEHAWLYLVPIGLAIALGCLLWGIARRVAGYYLVTAVLCFCLFTWVYWSSPNTLSWYLGSSAPRVIDVIVVLAAVATAHLSAEAYGQGGRWPAGSLPRNLKLVRKLR